MANDVPTPQEFFAGSPHGLAVLQAVASAIESFGPVEVRVSKSQVVFRRGRGFAYVWRPARHLRSDVPAVLSIAVPTRLESSRFREVVHPSSDRWVHQLEMSAADQVDGEVVGWLREAYDSAG